MQRHPVRSAAAIAATLTVLALPAGALAADPSGAPPAAPETVVSGLVNPRGFLWAEDGSLLVSLAGTGGDQEGIWQGMPSGIFGGPTSSVVRIVDGCQQPVATGIASAIWRDADWVWGVMDLAELDGTLYALLSGGGADAGLPDSPNGIAVVNPDGTTTLIADLSSWLGDVPPHEVAPDYNSDGSLFDMEAGDGKLWISEAVGGRLLTVAPDGTITLVADLSAGHLVPTGVALAPDGGAYVGFETAGPWVDGSSKVVHVAADGTVTDAWTGLTAVTDVALGPDGLLYAAEMATGNSADAPNIHPGTGRVVRQDGKGGLEVVAEGLDLPSYLGFAPDGSLWVASPAFGADNGEGTLARISLDGTAAPVTPAASCPPAS